MLIAGASTLVFAAIIAALFWSRYGVWAGAAGFVAAALLEAATWCFFLRRRRQMLKDGTLYARRR